MKGGFQRYANAIGNYFKGNLIMIDKTRELAFDKANGFCMCRPNCFKKADEIHHMLSNTKVNKQKFPLFIESVFNLCPVNHDCHMSGFVPRIKDHEAQAYEKWLEIFKDLK